MMHNRPTDRAGHRRRPSPLTAARGMSLVELMVGITIGLFILAAASLVATSQLGDNRRLLLEAQVQQDVRLAAELIARDLGRAGYWGNSHNAVWPSDLAVALNNPYRAITPENAASSASITFSRSLDEENNPIITSENNTLDVPEAAGYRHNALAQTIEIQLGDGNWQTLTDPAVLRITGFSVRITSNETDVVCGAQCPALGPGGCRLKQVQRNATIDIQGQATSDANVRRSVSSDVRLRNDVVKCV